MFEGMNKNTWATSDPLKCAKWFVKYVPGVRYEGNECPGNVCPCATEGRVHMANATGTGLSDDTFGVHSVNCKYHPHGKCPIAEIEAGWQAQFGNFSKYTPLMDFNLGLWAHSLAQVLDNFDRDGIQYFLMRWTHQGKEYYSAITSPCGYALIEFISDDISQRPAKSFHAVNSRMQFIEWNGPYSPTESNPLGLYPIKISRPTTKLEEVTSFYVEVFKATVLHNETFADGARLVTLKFPDTSTGPIKIPVQLWSRPEEPSKSTGCDEWTVAKWEEYLLSTHQAEMRGMSCGMDRWLDNHFAINCNDPVKCDVANYAAGFDKYGIKYRVDPFGQESDPLWFVYSYDPSGQGVELHFAHWTNPPPGLWEANPPSCIHGSFDNGTCAGQEPGQCT